MMSQPKSHSTYYLAAFLAFLSFLFAISCVQQKFRNQENYVLSLLWWPEYCQNHRQLQACGGASFRGFVVQGLLPEASSGNQLTSCGVKSGPSDQLKLLDIIPDRFLVEEVWQKYGACSEMTADNYFDLVRRAFSSIRIPSTFVNPEEHFVISPQEIKQAFMKANVGLTKDGVRIICNQANLSEVRICMSKQLHLTDCPALSDCERTVVKVIARMPLAE